MDSSRLNPTFRPKDLIPSDRYQRWAFLALVGIFVASWIKPPYLEFLLMQHAPTAVAIVLLGFLSNKIVLSRFSFLLIVIFLALHTLGARYLYSYTPYDAWAERLFGVGLSETFGWERNHYDRFVHFSYGLLIAVPIQELERRYLGLSLFSSSLLAIECILATSATYELIEWLVAITFSPDWADQFLGMQGDIFDGQKDMALATGGAILAITLNAILNWRRPA